MSESPLTPAALWSPRALLRRTSQSAVAWSWVANGLRLASGLLLLPIVLRKLTPEELGMYYVFLKQAALGPVIDFGFGPTIMRFVAYAMGGATDLKGQGVAEAKHGGPNYRLLWQLLLTTRSLYGYLTVAVFGILATWGTYMVELGVYETPSVRLTRAAWAITVAATMLDLYSGWAIEFLRGMDRVKTAVRITVIAGLVRFFVAAGFLLGGAGLLSLPLATLLSSLLQTTLARAQCYRELAQEPRPASVKISDHLRILWPNSWRQGLLLCGNYVASTATMAMCLAFLGLDVNGQYGLSLQLLGIITGMAGAWMGVKWQLIGQYRARQDYAAIQHLLRIRFWLQYLTFLVMAGGLLLCGPWFLQWFGHGKEMLDSSWMLVLTLSTFLEWQTSLWGILISTENRIPYLWPSLASNALSLAISYTLMRTTGLGVGALILGPLITHSLFNYWYWPMVGARGIGTTWTRFHFSWGKPPP